MINAISQALETHTSLISKPNYDHALWSNYRPISLTKVDLTIYSKMLANRLQPLLSKLIHLDQEGFISSREAGDNTLKTILLMKMRKCQMFPCAFFQLTLRWLLRWSFLKHTLMKISFGPKLISNILALYSTPDVTSYLPFLSFYPHSIGGLDSPGPYQKEY